MKSQALAAALTIFFTFTASAEPVFKPLADVRDSLSLPDYSREEKLILVDQATVVLRDLFVHRELKLAQLGQGIDPVPRLKQLREKVDELSPEQFHEELSKIFRELRDPHTMYPAPAPRACGTAVLPLRFSGVKDGEKDVLLVSGKLKAAESKTAGIGNGDELIAVNGLSTEKAISELSKLADAPDPDALRFRSIQMLSLRVLAIQPMPPPGPVKLKLKGAGGEYEKELDWTAMVDEACLHASTFPIPGNFLDFSTLGEDEFQKKYNEVFDAAEDDEWQPGMTSPFTEIFETGVVAVPSGKLRYLKIKTFASRNPALDVHAIAEGIRVAIERDAEQFKGLIVDVRGNPGGNILLAERLVQLFSSRAVEPSMARMLANDLNERIFLRANSGENRWTAAVREGKQAGKPLTDPIALSPFSAANDVGQIWHRPVVVLTDASCYSACDVFAAQMQDYGAAEIIGMHKTTGGGGANVMTHSTFRAVLGTGPDNPLKPLPRKQNMRVSWRQVLRTGKHAGQLIEGKGVESDVVIPISKAHLADPRIILLELDKTITKLEPRYRSGLAKRSDVVVSKNDETAAWKEKVHGVDGVEILVDGKTLATVSVPLSESPKEVELSAPSLKGSWADRSVVIVGKKGQTPVFRAVRELKWRGDYLEIPEDGISHGFDAGDIGPFQVSTLRGREGTGWQVVDGVLRVGPGPKYENNVRTRAFLPLQLNRKGGQIAFELSLLAEELHDNLRVYVVSPDTGEKRQVYSGSALPRPARLRLVLPKDLERADVVLEFESDENWNLRGPILDNLVIVQ